MGEKIIELGQRVPGLDDAIKQLEALNDRERLNIVRGGLRAAAKIIADQAKADVPVGRTARKVPGYGLLQPGSLKRSIRVSSRARKAYDGQGLQVGAAGVTARVVMGNRKKGVYWAHFVERGTRPHRIAPKDGKGGLFVAGRWVRRVQHPGAQARRTLEYAGMKAKSRAEEAFRAYCERRLERLLRTRAATGDAA